MPLEQQEKPKDGVVAPPKTSFTPTKDDPIGNAVLAQPNKEKSRAAIDATKANSRSLADKILGGPSRFLFGTTSKNVGSLIGSGVESAQELITGKPSARRFIDEKGISRHRPGVDDILFTALEMAPGGGAITKPLKAGAMKLTGPLRTAAQSFLTKAPKLNNLLGKLKAPTGKQLKEKALDQYYKIFRPGTKETKALAEQVSPRLLKEKKIITSPKALEEQAKRKAKVAGEKVGAWFDNLKEGVKEEVKPIVDKLNEFKARYQVKGVNLNKEAVKAADEALENIQKIAVEGKVDIKDFRKMRQIWDEHYSVSKGLDDISGYRKKVDRIGADSIRNELAKKHPDLDVLNKEYAFWTKVGDLAEYTKGKPKPRLSPTLGGVVGGAAGLASGTGVLGKAGGALAGTAIGRKIIQAVNSPAWQSINAIHKDKLARYMIEGNMDKLNHQLGKILAISKNILEE